MNIKKEYSALKKADLKTQLYLFNIRSILEKDHTDLFLLKNTLIELLEYLSSSEGRTDANCRSVDYYFMNDDIWSGKDLPDSFHDIFADMASALHDTVSSPEIAINFDSSPEQLLERAKKIEVPNL